MTKESTLNLFRRREQLNGIGAALSRERDIDRLLENILEAAKAITGADGGTLYSVTEDQSALKFEILRTDSLGIRLGGTTGKPVDFPQLPLRHPDGSPNDSLVAAHAVEFAAGARGYQRGDPMKLIVWKKFARSGELVARDTVHMQRQELWLDFARAGAIDAEARLARLAAWVLAADAQGLDYGLRVPGREISPANGAAHRVQCLEALALC